MFTPFLSLQAFLKSEVSAENILFWQACEKFKKIPSASVDEVRWPSITCLNWTQRVSNENKVATVHVVNFS